MDTASPRFPAVVITSAIVLGMGITLLLHVFSQTDFYFTNKLSYARDYYDFFMASRFILDGRSPYDARYVFPPLFAQLNTVLVPLGFLNAGIVISGLVFLSVLTAYAVITRHLFYAERATYGILLAFGLITIMFSYPFLFLYDRANIDGFVVCFLCISLIFAQRFPSLAGFFLALAVSFKVYPVLIVFPALIFRRWRLLVWAAVFQILFMLPSPSTWIMFPGEALSEERSMYIRFDENGSIYSTFWWFGKFFEPMLDQWGAAPRVIGTLLILSYVVYAYLLAFCAYADYKTSAIKKVDAREFTVRALMYGPFMVAIPRLAFHYELVILLPLIPVVCYEWGRTADRAQRRALTVLIIGIALTQVQAIALARVLHSEAMNLVPGFGLLLVMCGCMAYKMMTLRTITENTDETVNGGEAAPA